MAAAARVLPKAVVFDVLGTLVPLDGIRQGLKKVGLPEHRAETWFNRCQRDGIAAATTGKIAAFKDLGAYHLQVLLAEAGMDSDAAAVDNFFDSFLAVGLSADAVDGIQRMAGADIEICSFTNGAAAVTAAMFKKAGLDTLADPQLQLQVAEAGVWKPAAASYGYALSVLQEKKGLHANEVMMVSAGPWDINGAKCAGMQAGFIAFHGEPFPAFYEQPDIIASGIGHLADLLIK